MDLSLIQRSAASTCYLQANHNWVGKTCLLRGRKRRWPVSDLSASKERPRIATLDEIKVKEPFPLSSRLCLPQGSGRYCCGDWGRGAAEVAPHRGKGPGALGERSAGRGMVTIPPGAPAPPAAAGWGRVGRQPGLGVGERDGPGGLASPPPPSQ